MVLAAGLLLLPQLSQAVEIEMINIPAGSFNVGSAEQSVHIHALKIMKYEVTQALWKSVMGSNPSHFKGDNRPVENVSWFDAQHFIELLNRKTGKSYRLPSETEWEYALRAGSSSKWSWGDSESMAWKYAWYDANSDKQTHPVGRKKPNRWGLYDMHGNVWEWVDDCYNNYSGAPSDGSARESGDCSERVLRGGSWYDDPVFMRSANRGRKPAGHRSSNFGFRLVHD